MAVKRGVPGASLPELRERRVRPVAQPGRSRRPQRICRGARSDVRDEPVPSPPFWGARVVKGMPLADYARYLDERATFIGQWGLKPTGRGGAVVEELVETEGRPRLRMWLERVQTEGLLEAAVVYGYFPCVSDGDDLIVLETTEPSGALHVPAPAARPALCLADFFRPGSSGELDVVAFQLVTIGPRISEATAELFAKHAYRDYLELHGLSVQLTEALAEYWHARIARSSASGRRPRRPDEHPAGRLPGLPLLLRLPGLPDLEDRAKVMRLLEPERIGVTLSEEFQLAPEQSTDALIAHHPEAKYFSA